MTAKVNIIINQGSTFYQEIQLQDDNDDDLIVTGGGGNSLYTAASQMRKSYQASNAVSFDTALSNGMLILSMTSNATADIVGGRYVYDVELTTVSDGSVDRLIEGVVTVTPEATKV